MGYYNLFDFANCKHFRFAQWIIDSPINTKVHCYFEFCKTYLIFFFFDLRLLIIFFGIKIIYRKLGWVEQLCRFDPCEPSSVPSWLTSQPNSKTMLQFRNTRCCQCLKIRGWEIVVWSMEKEKGAWLHVLWQSMLRKHMDCYGPCLWGGEIW